MDHPCWLLSLRKLTHIDPPLSLLSLFLGRKGSALAVVLTGRGRSVPWTTFCMFSIHAMWNNQIGNETKSNILTFFQPTQSKLEISAFDRADTYNHDDWPICLVLGTPHRWHKHKNGQSRVVVNPWPCRRTRGVWFERDRRRLLLRLRPFGVFRSLRLAWARTLGGSLLRYLLNLTLQNTSL